MDRLNAKARGGREPSTLRIFPYYLFKFCEYAKKDPEQLITERLQDQKSDEMSTRRRHEELLTRWIGKMQEDRISSNTIATSCGAVRSFYAASYVPIVGVYVPSGVAVKIFRLPTPSDLFQMVDMSEPRAKAWICCQKDCLHPDTRLQSENGAITKIKDATSLTTILSANSIEPSTSMVGSVFTKPPEDLLDIRTRHGHISSSFQHFFQVYDNGTLAWKRADTLSDSDFLVRLGKIQVKTKPQYLKPVKGAAQCMAIFPEFLNENLSQLLGYFAGDGHIPIWKGKRLGRIIFTDENKEILEFYSQLLKILLQGHHPKIKNGARQRLSVTCGPLVRLIMENCPEIVCRSRFRHVPQIVCRSPDAIVARFLRGLFDAEGYVGCRIELVNTSFELLEEVSLLLLRFGILSHVKEYITPEREINKKRIKETKAWALIVEGINTVLFREHVGFSHPRKNERLSQIHVDLKRSDKDVRMPIERELLQQLLKEHHTCLEVMLHPERKRGKHPHKADYRSFRATRANIQRILQNADPSAISTKELKKTLDSGVIAERIISISHLENKTASLKDLNMPSTSIYYANAFCVHNSGISGGDLISLRLDNKSPIYGTIRSQLLKKGSIPIHVYLERGKGMSRGLGHYDTFFGKDAISALRSFVDLNASSDAKLFNFTEKTAELLLKAVSEKVMGEHITPHILRKFFNTYMKLAKVNESVIEYWMGHSLGKVKSAYFVPPVQEQMKLYMEAYPHIAIPK